MSISMDDLVLVFSDADICMPASTSSTDFINEMQGLSDLISVIHKWQCTCTCLESFYTQAIWDGQTWGFYLYDPSSPLDRDLRLTLCVQAQKFAAFDGAVTPSISAQNIAIQAIQNRKAAALIVLPRYSRIAENVCNGLPLFFLGNKVHFLSYQQTIPEYCDCSPIDYIEYGKYLFPSLFFAIGLQRQFRNFHEPYSSIRSKITAGLSYLNDHFLTVAAQNNFLPDPIEADFLSKVSSVHGISPESAKTNNNRSCRAVRTIDLTGKKVYCEWHVKISPTYDRIYFAWNKDDRELVSGKIIIGIFHKHLKT